MLWLPFYKLACHCSHFCFVLTSHLFRQWSGSTPGGAQRLWYNVVLELNWNQQRKIVSLIPVLCLCLWKTSLKFRATSSNSVPTSAYKFVFPSVYFLLLFSNIVVIFVISHLSFLLGTSVVKIKILKLLIFTHMLDSIDLKQSEASENFFLAMSVTVWMICFVTRWIAVIHIWKFYLL